MKQWHHAAVGCASSMTPPGKNARRKVAMKATATEHNVLLELHVEKRTLSSLSAHSVWVSTTRVVCNAMRGCQKRWRATSTAWRVPEIHDKRGMKIKRNKHAFTMRRNSYIPRANTILHTAELSSVCSTGNRVFSWSLCILLFKPSCLR
jgi:hypothetical protein